VGASGLVVETASVARGALASGVSLPIVVFSKVYQELSLSFSDAAEVTSLAGLQGVDPPVRPGGEILPERCEEDLPRYAAALKERGLRMPFLTTAITSISSPHAETILRVAKSVGVQSYRIGFVERQRNGPVAAQIREVKAQLKELAALNHGLGIGAIFQNHSPGTHAYLGGDLEELREIVSDFKPGEIGVAFDIGHALIVHGTGWRAHFEALKPHLKVAYMKDVNAEKQWVPFGQGEIGRVGYFPLLRQMGYQAPLCLHIEYDWSHRGKFKNRPTLVNALRESATVIRGWSA
jgi:sugar phosphate isomerase/epimerase